MMQKKNSMNSALEIHLYLSFKEHEDFCSWLIRKSLIHRIRPWHHQAEESEEKKRKNYPERIVLYAYFQISACPVKNAEEEG